MALLQEPPLAVWQVRALEPLLLEPLLLALARALAVAASLELLADLPWQATPRPGCRRS